MRSNDDTIKIKCFNTKVYSGKVTAGNIVLILDSVMEDSFIFRYENTLQFYDQRNTFALDVYAKAYVGDDEFITYRYRIQNNLPRI